MPDRSFVANGKTYRIQAHAWRKIREIDIDLADVVRIIEAAKNTTKLKHKTEYVDCYTPRWLQRRGEQRQMQVKIVINTRSTLTLKTVHQAGDCPEE